MSARERILGRVEDARAQLGSIPHPGKFEGWRPEAQEREALASFEHLFRRAGGEVVRVADAAAARRWISSFAEDYDGVAVGTTVPAHLRIGASEAPAEEAALGVSMARGAVAETGSLVLDARDGRRTQLLPPTHVVVLRAETVWMTLVEALQELRRDLPAALGLHSGPSKSADIGQILVKGVHGPGRLVALVVEAGADTP